MSGEEVTLIKNYFTNKMIIMHFKFACKLLYNNEHVYKNKKSLY